MNDLGNGSATRGHMVTKASFGLLFSLVYWRQSDVDLELRDGYWMDGKMPMDGRHDTQMCFFPGHGMNIHKLGLLLFDCAI